MMTFREQLLHVADLYCHAVGRSRSRVSTIVLGRGSKLDDLASGGDVTTRIYEQALLWFSDNWPDEAVWPVGVSRPLARAQAPGEGAASALPAAGGGTAGGGGNVDLDHDGETAANRRAPHVNSPIKPSHELTDGAAAGKDAA